MKNIMKFVYAVGIFLTVSLSAMDNFDGYPKTGNYTNVGNNNQDLLKRIEKLETDNSNFRRELDTIHKNLGAQEQNSAQPKTNYKKMGLALLENTYNVAVKVLPPARTVEAFMVGNFIFALLGCGVFHIFGSKKGYYSLLKEDVSKKILVPLNGLAMLFCVFPNYFK